MNAPKLTRSQRRMIRLFERTGARHFRVLRSAETSLRTFRRPTRAARVTPPAETGDDS